MGRAGGVMVCVGEGVENGGWRMENGLSAESTRADVKQAPMQGPPTLSLGLSRKAPKTSNKIYVIQICILKSYKYVPGHDHKLDHSRSLVYR